MSRLSALHANTYDYLIENATEWGDLPGFLTTANAAGINVIAYLIPPSECQPSDCSTYLPDGKDYVQWGTDIGALAAQHPHLTAWTVDDMDYNLALFTPAYVQQMTNAATAQAPQLKFYLQLFQPKITQTLLASYTSAAGVIMPFRDGANADTVWTDTLQAEIDSVTAMLPSGKQLIVMLYANTLGGTTLTPDTDYVSTVTSTAIANTQSGKIAGVILWKLMLDPTGAPANLSEQTQYHAVTHSGIGALDFTVNANTATKAGDYAKADTTVTLDPGSTSCTLAIHRIDDRPTTAPAGYHDKEVYVGNTLVWGMDVAGDGTDCFQDRLAGESGRVGVLGRRRMDHRITGCGKPGSGSRGTCGRGAVDCVQGITYGEPSRSEHKYPVRRRHRGVHASAQDSPRLASVHVRRFARTGAGQPCGSCGRWPGTAAARRRLGARQEQQQTAVDDQAARRRPPAVRRSRKLRTTSRPVCELAQSGRGPGPVTHGNRTANEAT